MNEKTTLSSAEVCERLGISTATLNRRVANGELKPANARTPGQKRIPRYHFDLEDVERLIRETAEAAQ